MDNKTNSAVFQAIEDLRRIALSRGLNDLANSLKDSLSNCPDSVLSEADKVFSSHVYPDHTLQWVKMPVKGYSCSVLDNLPPDAFSLLMRLVYRLSSYSPFIAFKRADLVHMTGWSDFKVKSILQILKKRSVIAVYDDSSFRSFGTIYMINPNIIDVSGTSRMKGFYCTVWKSLFPSDGSAPEESVDLDSFSLSKDCKVSVLNEKFNRRINVSLIDDKYH